MAAQPLTALSVNLWHDWPRHRRALQRLEAVARLVEREHADVVLLQEVTRRRDFAADRWLADRLGMHATYVRANGSMGAVGFEEGLAVLSSLVPVGTASRRLSSGYHPFVRRMALAVWLDLPTGPVVAVSAHLGLLAAHNARQVARLRAWVAALAGDAPAIVGGDFNAPEHRAPITSAQASWTDTFRARHPHAPAATHRKHRRWRPALHRRLDYVFVQQPPGPRWRVVDARHVDAPGGAHSDHRAVLARLAPGSGASASAP